MDQMIQRDLTKKKDSFMNLTSPLLSLL